MELVTVKQKRFADYLPFLDPPVREEIEELAARLQGKKVAMINATTFGGGVAEKLHSLVPLIKDLGIHLDWWVFEGSLEFYQVTKVLHNRLQGQEGSMTPQEVEIFDQYNRANAATMANWDYDLVVVHDPQPAALIHYRQDLGRTKWIWRCHIDTSTPNEECWDFICQYIRQYDATIFTMPDFVKEGSRLNRLTFITPSIDPLSRKNILLDPEEARKIVARFGVDTNRPLITQVSRFDPWKDPLGVIEAYKIVKKDFPSVQLALVGSMATDDPEGWDYLYYTLRRAGEDYDIKVVTNFNGISDLEVNAFQTASEILLQKSLREGFGLTVAEGLWKGTPVIGGKVGGIKLQIEDGVNGYLVETVEECADRVLNLLRNPSLLHDFAAAGKEKVRRHFLITINVLNYLRLFADLMPEGC
ncbi:MAG: glycosyltransferase [Dethiobacteria bacterium]|jgi:trehalose synthase|nr:glycosyltransferase [Bacillota bacterium]HOP69125.1 glycosyltransferase [Bacillota bacterium]HPT33640.1 glycosyltransferase [Bacillota bacterium]HPZ64628.1 glycosyltransferase [Bacillota bacterium]HQD06546.1 glycosyltransferase [Bacillota bacterium]